MKIIKTIKLFIGGDFPRTESGRSFAVNYFNSEKVYANLCRASRKDVRMAVEKAIAAQKVWSSKTAYNRGQVIYRMAEMCEAKRLEFTGLFKDTLGHNDTKAQKEVDGAIDAFIYYAGFCDKYQQLIGTVNPVAGPHHNFTVPEPVGVVGYFAPSKFHFGHLISQLSSLVASGNSIVALLGSQCQAVLAPLAEVFATSDLPKGVINLLTGFQEELLEPLGSHMEVEAISFQNESQEDLSRIKELGVPNMKRIIPPQKQVRSLRAITNFVEQKTIWHPIGF